MLTVQATNTGFAGTVAHVHRGAAGVAGPVVFGLTGGPNTWTGTGTLSATDVGDLLNEGLYVNIHSAAFPGGEVRGQLIAATNLMARATGNLEMPPTGSAGIARGRFVLDQATNQLQYNVEVTGFTPTVAHIHLGSVGVNGGVVFPLTLTGPTTYSGTTAALSNAQLQILWSQGFYLNVHSAAFPGGEVRDQLRPGTLNGNATRYPLAKGGPMALDIDGPPGTANFLYLVLGSLSGTAPGLALSGQVLPLNFDAYLNLTLTAPNSPPLGNSFGFRNASASAQATFGLPPAAFPTLAGLTVNHAAVLINPINTADIELGSAFATLFF